MAWTVINQDRLFKEIMSGNDVFIANPDEETCQWTNALTVDDLVKLSKNENVVIFCKKEQVEKPTQDAFYSTVKRIDREKLALKMKQQMLSQNELAKLSGVSGWTINRLVHEGGRPRKQTLKMLCKALGCIEDEILEE